MFCAIRGLALLARALFLSWVVPLCSAYSARCGGGLSSLRLHCAGISSPHNTACADRPHSSPEENIDDDQTSLLQVDEVIILRDVPQPTGPQARPVDSGSPFARFVNAVRNQHRQHQVDVSPSPALAPAFLPPPAPLPWQAEFRFGSKPQWTRGRHRGFPPPRMFSLSQTASGSHGSQWPTLGTSPALKIAAVIHDADDLDHPATAAALRKEEQPTEQHTEQNSDAAGSEQDGAEELAEEAAEEEPAAQEHSTDEAEEAAAAEEQSTGKANEPDDAEASEADADDEHASAAVTEGRARNGFPQPHFALRPRTTPTEGEDALMQVEASPGSGIETLLKTGRWSPEAFRKAEKVHSKKYKLEEADEEPTVKAGAGYVRWVPNATFCFHAEGEGSLITLEECLANNTYQMFNFPPAGTPGPIRWALEPEQCVDVGTDTIGTRVKLWPCVPGQSNQMFVVSMAGTEAPILVKSTRSDLCLDVSDRGFTVDGTYIVMNTCGAEGENQNFKFEFAANSIDTATKGERDAEAAAQQEQACRLATAGCGAEQGASAYCPADGYAGPAVAGGYISGTGFEVVMVQGMERGEGSAYAEPEATLFRWGSVSGTLVGTVAAILAAKGDIDLDADIHDYFDIQQEFGVEWPSSYLTCPDGSSAAHTYRFDHKNRDCLAATEIPPEKRKVTLRKLLAHTAGVQHYVNGNGSAVPPVEMIDDPEINTGMAWALEYLFDKPLVALPGETTSYSSFGLNLAAVTIHRAMNTTFKDLVESLVSQPLGLCSLVPGYGWVKQPRAAVGYDGNGEQLELHDVSWKLGSEGYIGSSADLMRYGRALAADTEWLPEDVRYSPEYGLFAEVEELMHPSVGHAGTSVQYSMSFGQVFHGNDPVRVGHVGGTEGAWATLAVYLAESRSSIAVTTNSSCVGCSSKAFKGKTSTEVVAALERAMEPFVEQGADEQSSCLPQGQCFAPTPTTSAPSTSSVPSYTFPPYSTKDPDFVVPLYYQKAS